MAAPRRQPPPARGEGLGLAEPQVPEPAQRLGPQGRIGTVDAQEVLVAARGLRGVRRRGHPGLHLDATVGEVRERRGAIGLARRPGRRCESDRAGERRDETTRGSLRASGGRTVVQRGQRELGLRGIAREPRLLCLELADGDVRQHLLLRGLGGVDPRLQARHAPL